MKFSVIIPTFKRQELLQKLLDILLAQTFRHNEYEIIVVDDAREKNVEALVHETAEKNAFPLHYLSQANQGPGCARNTGSDIAQGEFLVFLDDDCTIFEHWLERLNQAIAEHPETDIFYGPVISGQVNSRYPFLHAFQRQGEADQGSNIAFRKSVFQTLNGYDPSLSFWGEDEDLILRAKSREVKFQYLPEWLCEHPARYTSPVYPTLKEFMSQLRRFETFLKKYRTDRSVQLSFIRWQRFGSRFISRVLFWVLPLLWVSPLRAILIGLFLNVAFDAFRLYRIQRYLVVHGFSIAPQDTWRYFCFNWWLDFIELARLLMLTPVIMTPFMIGKKKQTG